MMQNQNNLIGFKRFSSSALFLSFPLVEVAVRISFEDLARIWRILKVKTSGDRPEGEAVEIMPDGSRLAARAGR